jgi:hypothetical protein
MKLSRRTIIISTIIAGILVVVSGVLLSNALRQPSQAEEPTQDIALQSEPEPETSTTEPETTAPVVTVDPTTVDSVDIVPLDITVSYVKGIPGFTYAIQRSQNGTRYIEFSSADLIGTKCTDDTGIFASIIENPSPDTEGATVSTTTTVGQDTYGLSLATDTCTSNPELLKQYQASFNDAFTLLRSINSNTDEVE